MVEERDNDGVEEADADPRVGAGPPPSPAVADAPAQAGADAAAPGDGVLMQPPAALDDSLDLGAGDEPPDEPVAGPVAASESAGEPTAAAVDGDEDGAGDDDASVESNLPDEELDRVVEAILFASGSPLTAARIAKAALVATRRIRRSIGRLRREYAESLRAFDVMEIAGGFKLYSRPEYEEYLLRLEKVKAPEKLSASSLETLAIVAYRQPIIRADIDAIRGVQSGAILRALMERKLVRVVGRSDQPGRPLMYGTTKRFLDHFGLSSVKDLPRVEDLKAP